MESTQSGSYDLYCTLQNLNTNEKQQREMRSSKCCEIEYRDNVLQHTDKEDKGS